MTRIARSMGSGAGLRLGVLLATVAVFLLVFAVSAFARTAHVEVSFVGSGSGSIEGGAGKEGGEPHLKCHWNGTAIDEGTPEAGKCETTAVEVEPGLVGVIPEAKPDAGSEFGGWELQEPGSEEDGVLLCSEDHPLEVSCGMLSFGTPIKVRAIFNASVATEVPLAINDGAGTGSGQVNCQVVGGSLDKPCAAEYPAGTELELVAEAHEGSIFKQFENAGGSASTSCAGTPATCVFTIEEATAIEANFELETRELKVNESGPGSVEVQCEGSPCASLTAIPYGTNVTVTAEAGAGARTTVFEGAGSAAGCEAEGSPCHFQIKADSSVTAEFEAVPSFPVAVTVAGQGEVTSTPAGIECTEAGNGGPKCEEEVAEGSTVTLHQVPSAGWKFEGWTGVACNGGNSGSSCTFTMPATALSVKAKYAEVTSSLLSVFVNGAGAVSADSGPISGCTEAGGAACEGQYEGTVVLTETPTAGHVFAGWVGCKHKSATACEVTVDAAREVYAVFLAEGAKGAPGENGETPTLATLPVGDVHCPNGGIEVTLGASHTYACNGAKGTNGTNGTNGSDGAAGAAGEKGASGPQGPAGSQGPAGPQGPQGPAGQEGKQGPAGPSGRIVCKAKHKHGRIIVNCTIKPGSAKKASSARVHWQLTRHGHRVRHGETVIGRELRLRLGHLRAGSYRLHVHGVHRAISIIVG